MFRAFVLDVGKPSSSLWLNHLHRWFVHVSPASPATAPGSRLLPHSRKGRYLESFHFIPSRSKENFWTLVLFFFDRRRLCSSSDSGMVWNVIGHSLTLAHDPIGELTTALLADRRAWLLLTCWGVSKQAQQQGRSETETLSCWRNPHWVLCAQKVHWV